MHTHRSMAIRIEAHQRHVAVWRHTFGTASLACGVGALWCALNVTNATIALLGTLALLAVAGLLHAVCEAVG